MPPNSSPTFTPRTLINLVQFLIYKPCSVLSSFLFAPLFRLTLFKKTRKKFLLLYISHFSPLSPLSLHSAWPLSVPLSIPLPPPPSHFPPTRLIPTIPPHCTI